MLLNIIKNTFQEDVGTYLNKKKTMKEIIYTLIMNIHIHINYKSAVKSAW